MHLLERAGALAELDELSRQWRAGQLTNAEYSFAFRQVDSAHSHDLKCANGDGRLAVLNVSGKLLCGVCALKRREARA